MPPPHRRNVPRSYQPKKSSTSCCCKCICCCCCFLLIFILVLGGLAFYLYHVYKPKMPAYTVEGMDVKDFDVKDDFSLTTDLLVRVKAENPNAHVGFVYHKNSSVVVTYTGSVLSSGELPHFTQEPLNTTVMVIEMRGESEFGSDLQKALQENKKTGRIPLLVKVEAPVSIVMEKLESREFVVYVNCSLVVDNLQLGKKVGIVESEYSFDVKF
ncbi:PREDICTED: uncharacterized protein LOC109188310 [Ipomoea nil]|uniref:uncharacterized protein LOC109188310 n=1 Tax=Ipomoea nil TaxID=35883 RepID=UPI0009008819|nr:PREDICTED: uncharacterized protein LOC109188310 [Ipomoea nil]